MVLTTCGRWLWDSSGPCRRSDWLSPSPSSSLDVCDNMSVHSAAMHELVSLERTGACLTGCLAGYCVYGASARHASAVHGHDLKLRIVYTRSRPVAVCVQERDRRRAYRRCLSHQRRLLEHTPARTSIKAVSRRCIVLPLYNDDTSDDPMTI